jgi:hypothetical protein
VNGQIPQISIVEEQVFSTTIYYTIANNFLTGM